MALPIIADTLRVAVQGIATNSHKWENVLHFRKTGALTFAGAIAVLDPLLLAHYRTNVAGGEAWQAAAPTTASLAQFVYTPLDGTSASTIITHAFAGLDAGDPLPVSTCLVVTARTALRGRSYRGRVYTGPYPETYNTAGAPVTSLVAAVAVQWDYLATTRLAGSGVSWVVASYLHSTAQDILHATVDGRWDTQRRRLNS
jgi:hypothetical protein